MIIALLLLAYACAGVALGAVLLAIVVGFFRLLQFLFDL